MKNKEIFNSINLVKIRIDRIKEILNYKSKIILVDSKLFYESLRLNLIEIGEEYKNINDFLAEVEGKWNDIISRQYNIRISLTHYYTNITNEIIEKHIKNKFDLFVDEINNLEKKYNGES